MNEIDDYMDLDPNEMSKADIEKIIAYQRKYRATLEAGGGRKRAKKEEGPKSKLDLSSILAAIPVAAPVAPTIKRRV